VFHWFNGQWPDLMGECIAAYNTMNYDRLEGHKYCDADRLVDSKVTTRKLRTAISLIQEAKGFEGVNGGPITDHLDAAENWINHVMLALESKT
jgi:predicted dinucleotide-binding enzyme